MKGTIVAKVLSAVPPGSFLAITHAGGDLLEPDMLERLRESWSGKIQQQTTWRTREQVASFFDGTDLVAPGLVPVEDWRPDPGTAGAGRSAGWSGVGRKRLTAAGAPSPDRPQARKAAN